MRGYHLTYVAQETKLHFVLCCPVPRTLREEREWERERDRERYIERDRDRETERQTNTDRQRQTEAETEVKKICEGNTIYTQNQNRSPIEVCGKSTAVKMSILNDSTLTFNIKIESLFSWTSIVV